MSNEAEIKAFEALQHCNAALHLARGHIVPGRGTARDIAIVNHAMASSESALEMLGLSEEALSDCVKRRTG